MIITESRAGERTEVDIDDALAAEAQRVAEAKRQYIERIIEAKTRHGKTNVAIAAALGVTEGAVRAMIKRAQL